MYMYMHVNVFRVYRTGHSIGCWWVMLKVYNMKETAIYVFVD